MGMIAPKIQANIQEHVVMKWQEALAAQADSMQQQTQPANGNAPLEAIMAQAAQKLANTNQRMAQLEAESPDTARTLIAKAELMRVGNETRELEMKGDSEIAKASYDALKLELEKYKIDTQVAIEEMKAGMQAKLAELKSTSDIITNAAKIDQAERNSSRQSASPKAAPKSKTPPK
jgi:hypothetical protein